MIKRKWNCWIDEKVVESDSEYTTDELIVEVRVKRRTIFLGGTNSIVYLLA